MGTTSAIRTVLLAVAGVALVGARLPEVGQVAPDTTITLVDGSKVQLSSLRGEVVVLNFWATWCAPCRAELPLLDRYYAVQKDHGLRVFAVTTEGSAPLARLRQLFAAMAITPAKRVSGPYAQVRAVPTNYVVGRAGRLRYAKAGAFDLDDLNRELVPLLREPRPAPRRGDGGPGGPAPAPFGLSPSKPYRSPAKKNGLSTSSGRTGSGPPFLAPGPFRPKRASRQLFLPRQGGLAAAWGSRPSLLHLLLAEENRPT